MSTDIAVLDLLVSVFASCKRPDDAEQTTLDAVIARIRSDELRRQTEHIRQTFLAAGGLAAGQVAKDAIRDLKLALPTFTMTGTFSRRANDAWQMHNGIVQVDIDELTPEQVEDLRNRLAAHPSIVFVFVSPSGCGIKAGVLVPAIDPPTDAAYKPVWHKVNRWLKTTFNVENDQATKDCARLAFMACDPDMHYNAAAVPLVLAEDGHDPEDLFHNTPEVQPAVESMQPAAAALSDDDRRIVWGYISKIASVKGEKGNPGMMKVCRALRTGFALERAAAWPELSRWNTEIAKPPWSQGELARAMATVEGTRSTLPVGCLWENASTEIPSEDNDNDNLIVMRATDLVAAHPDYKPAIIDGLLREGETMNVIASPKVGKSWLVLLMAFCIANGVAFLGRQCAKGPVLIIDNELHPETAAQRLRAVASALSLPLDGIHLVSLRGLLQDLPTLRIRLEQAALSIGAKVIVLDALYRLLPSSTSENDNAGMMQLYNCIDRIARMTGAAVICIHHSSKGGQGEKAITDGGAGAGAISRAADSHIFLREHEDAGQVVVDAVARSWPPPQSIVIHRPGVVWEVMQGADPRRIKGRKTKAGADVLSLDDLRDTYLAQFPEPVKTIMARIKGSGLNPSMTALEGMLGLAASKGEAVCEIGRGGAKLYGRELTPGGNGTVLDKVVDYLRVHPHAGHAEVAAACGCSTKTVQRALDRSAA